MTPNFMNPVQWGQIKKIVPGNWQQNRPVPLCNLDRVIVPHPQGHELIHTPRGSMHGIGRVPKVQNISLSLVGRPTGQCIIRWQLDFGCGGGATQVLVDANGFQQLSLSADWLRISLLATSIGAHSGVGYSGPTTDLDAVAFFADGMTATDAPTFTEFFTIAPDSNVTLTPPTGATGFRVIGNPTNLSPFASDVSYQVTYVDGALTTDYYTGDFIEDQRLAPIPLVGGSQALLITNGNVATDVAGAIAWDLDF